VRWNAFVKNPNPHFPIDNFSYEAYDPNADHPIDRVFVAGWSREASSGLVGVARKDGESGAQAVLQYLQTQPLLRNPTEILEDWQQHLNRLKKPVVTNADLLRLETVEQAERQKGALDDYKFSSNDEMLAAMELRK
jgi:ferredoxin--NADP+ reductase